MTEASGSNGIGSFATLGAVISNVIKPGRLTSVLGKHAWQPRVQSRSLARLQAQGRLIPLGRPTGLGFLTAVLPNRRRCCAELVLSIRISSIRNSR